MFEWILKQPDCFLPLFALPVKKFFTLSVVLISISCRSDNFHAIFAKIQFWKVFHIPQRPATFRFSFTLFVPSPLGILWRKRLCWKKTLLLFFRFRLLVFYPQVPHCFQTPVVYSKKIKETTLSCVLCSLMIPWGLTPFWLWPYLHLACRSVPCDTRSLASGQDETEKLIPMYKSPHRILPVWGIWLKSM